MAAQGPWPSPYTIPNCTTQLRDSGPDAPPTSAHLYVYTLTLTLSAHPHCSPSPSPSTVTLNPHPHTLTLTLTLTLTPSHPLTLTLYVYSSILYAISHLALDARVGPRLSS